MMLRSLILLAALAIAAVPGRAQDVTLSQRGPRFLVASGSQGAVEIDPAAAPLFQRRVTLSLEQTTVGEALAALGEAARIRLVYSRDVLDPDRPARIKADGITVAGALTEILLCAEVDVVLSSGDRITLDAGRPRRCRRGGAGCHGGCRARRRRGGLFLPRGAEYGGALRLHRSEPRWGRSADQGGTAFSKEPRGTNKIGLQMLDERLSMVSDPWDSEAPRTTVGRYGDPVDKVGWFEHGVLMDLLYSRSYAGERGREPVFAPTNLRLFGRGRTETLEEMIASTGCRGLV